MAIENTEEPLSLEEAVQQEENPVQEQETVEPTQSNTQTEPTNTNTNGQSNNNRSTRDSRREEREVLAKQIKDAQAWGTRSSQEAADLRRELAAIRQKYASLDPYAETIAKNAKAQEQFELQQLMKTDPVAAQKKIAEQLLKEQMAPIQQQIAQQNAERQQIANYQENMKFVNYLQQNLGEERYKALEPAMAEIVEAAGQSNPQYVGILKQNPNILYHLANSINMERQKSQVQQQKVVGQQNQQSNLNFAKTNLKSSQSTRKNTSTVQSKDAAYDAYKKALEAEGL